MALHENWGVSGDCMIAGCRKTLLPELDFIARSGILPIND